LTEDHGPRTTGPSFDAFDFHRLEPDFHSPACDALAAPPNWMPPGSPADMATEFVY
jgi:hypothetical protein